MSGLSFNWFLHHLTDLYRVLIYSSQCRTLVFISKEIPIINSYGLACCSKVCLACSRSLMPITMIRSVISSSSANSSRAWKNMFIYGQMKYKNICKHTRTHAPSGPFKHESVCVPHANRRAITSLSTLTLCVCCLSVFVHVVFPCVAIRVCVCVSVCHMFRIYEGLIEDLNHINLKRTRLFPRRLL